MLCVDARNQIMTTTSVTSCACPRYSSVAPAGACVLEHARWSTLRPREQASKIRTRVTPPLRTEWRARLHALAQSRIDPAQRTGPSAPKLPPPPAARGPRALLRCLLPTKPIRCPRPTRCPRPPARARPDAPSAVRHGPLAAAPSAAAAPGAGAR